MRSTSHGWSGHTGESERAGGGGGTPGQRTLTMALPATRNPIEPAAEPAYRPVADAAVVQRMLDDALRPDLAGGVHEAAAHGTSGSGGPLPFLDTIQPLFGRHDVRGVAAHTDDAARTGARQMGAEAFATGDHVAFGGPPSLHTAAHEAAHVVQQRAGVHLKGGVGAEGDVYERHADEVADLIVAGRSAEAVLDRHAGSGGTPQVQRKWLEDDGARFLRWDPPVDGLRWYLDPRTDVLFFQIERLPPVSERRLRLLESLEGPGNARPLDAWCKTEVFEPSKSSESTEVEPSGESVGPTTRRGVPIPRVGFGADIGLTDTEKEEAGNEEGQQRALEKKQQETLRMALATGYTMFDTAYEYGTTAFLGAEIERAQVPPEDVFITYKIKPSEVKEVYGGDIGAAVKVVLKELRRGWIDVLMLHDLNASDEELGLLAAQMKELVSGGVVRYLGLSNVTAPEKIDLCNQSGDKSIGVSFVQNKMHPHRQDEAMRKECDERGITYTGYSMMGSGGKTGKCGQVVTDEPDYDVRKDPTLGKIAEEENMPGGGPQLALAWGVESGTTQIPTSSDPQRQLDNLRSRFMPVSKGAMDKIHAMDDVITGAEQEELLAGIDQPRNKLKLAIPNKTHWKTIERMYGGGLGGILDALGLAVEADDGLVESVKALVGYAGMIDDGQATTKIFTDEFGDPIQPGDYSKITAAFATGTAATIVAQWWERALESGGCVRARTRVLGLIAIGGAGLEDEFDDEENQGKAVAKNDQRTIPISDLTLIYPDTLAVTGVDDPDSMGTLGGKNIEFSVLAINPPNVTIVILREM